MQQISGQSEPRERSKKYKLKSLIKITDLKCTERYEVIILNSKISP